MRSLLPVLGLAFASCAALADTSNPLCETDCTSTVQQMGDTSSSADHSQSESSQSNNSTASNVSGASITNAPRVQQSGNQVDQSGNTVDQSGSRQTATGGASSSASHGNENEVTTNANNSATNLGGSAINGGMDASTKSSAGIGDIGNEQGQGQSQSVTDSGNARNENAVANDQGQSQSVDGSGNSRNSSSNSSKVNSSNSQGQGIDRSGNSAVNNRTATEQGQGQSTDNAINVDASDRSRTSYSSKVDARSLYIPQVTAPVIPSVNPATSVSIVRGSCEPLFAIDRKVVNGKYVGLIWNSTIDLGHEDYKVDYIDENNYRIKYNAIQMPDGSWDIMGMRAIYFVAPLNVSGSRQLGIGGGSGFDHGQASGGSSSTMQMLVTNIQTEACLVGKIVAPPAPISHAQPSM